MPESAHALACGIRVKCCLIWSTLIPVSSGGHSPIKIWTTATHVVRVVVRTRHELRNDRRLTEITECIAKILGIGVVAVDVFTCSRVGKSCLDLVFAVDCIIPESFESIFRHVWSPFVSQKQTMQPRKHTQELQGLVGPVETVRVRDETNEYGLPKPRSAYSRVRESMTESEGIEDDTNVIHIELQVHDVQRDGVPVSTWVYLAKTSRSNICVASCFRRESCVVWRFIYMFVISAERQQTKNQTAQE